MVKLYVKLIKEGKMTLDEVPSKWYDKVKEELEKEEKPEIIDDEVGE